MEWKVTAFASEEQGNITFWLESSQRVTVGEYNEMDFGIWPTGVKEEGSHGKWKLKLTLRDGRDVIAEREFLYNTLNEATTDAEALTTYLQDTTDSPGRLPASVHTLIPTVRIDP